MKKSLIPLLILVLLLGACGKSTGTTKAKDEPIKLLFNFHAPSSHYLYAGAIQPWAEKVKEKTDGRIEIEVHTNATLGSSKSVYEDTKGGAYDIGIAAESYAYDTLIFPWTIVQLPLIFSDPVQTQRVMTKFGEKYGVDELNKEVKYLGTAGQDPYILVSSKPVKSVKDVKGMNIITFDRINNDLVSEWGASPLSIDHNEAYEALQRNTADAIFYTAGSSVSGMQYYEVAPHFVENLSLSSAQLTFIANKDKFDSLPDDLKGVFEELGQELADLTTQGYQKEYDQYAEKLKDLKGTTLTTLTDEQLEGFTKSAKTSAENWVKLANEKGYPGEEMLSYLIELLEEEGIDAQYLK